MPLTAGVTEIADSEEEPMTSSPACAHDGRLDKLLPTPQAVSQVFQDVQGWPGCEAQASAMTAALGGDESLVHDEENCLQRSHSSELHTSADQQAINNSSQHLPCGEFLDSTNHPIPEQTSQTIQTSSQNQSDDTENVHDTDDQKFVLEEPPPKRSKRSEKEERKLRRLQAMINIRKRGPEVLTPVEPEDGISVIDFAYPCEKAMSEEDSNKKQKRAEQTSGEEEMLSPAATSTDFQPTPPGLNEMGPGSGATSSQRGFIPNLADSEAQDYHGSGLNSATSDTVEAPVNGLPNQGMESSASLMDLDHTTKNGEEPPRLAPTVYKAATQTVFATDESSSQRGENSRNSDPGAPADIAVATSTPDSKAATPAMTAQETTLAELKAQRRALIASLAALPNIQEQIAANSFETGTDHASDAGPTDDEVMAAANKLVKQHIKLLHEYNEIKDVGQGLMGLIADQRGLRIIEVQEEFGIGEGD